MYLEYWQIIGLVVVCFWMGNRSALERRRNNTRLINPELDEVIHNYLDKRSDKRIKEILSNK